MNKQILNLKVTKSISMVTMLIYQKILRKYVCFLSMSLHNIRWSDAELEISFVSLNSTDLLFTSTQFYKNKSSFLSPRLARIDLNFAGSIFPYSFFILRGESFLLGFSYFMKSFRRQSQTIRKKKRKTGDFGHKLVSRRSIKEEKFVFDKAVEVRLCSFYVGNIKILFSLPVLGHRSTGWISSSRNFHIYDFVLFEASKGFCFSDPVTQISFNGH